MFSSGVVETCTAAGLIGGEGFAVDARLIAADANKQRSIPGAEWQKQRDAAMRKGYRREAMSEGSAEQTCELMDKNRIQGASVGRAGNVLRSPYPSRTRGVDPATVHGRRLNLPREVGDWGRRETA